MMEEEEEEGRKSMSIPTICSCEVCFHLSDIHLLPTKEGPSPTGPPLRALYPHLLLGTTDHRPQFSRQQETSSHRVRC